MAARSSVSIVVPTRNRPHDADACVAALLAIPERFQLVVIDQSDGPATRQTLERHMPDARLRYVTTVSRGVSAARNLGIAVSRAQLVAFTDDDCRVSGDWLTRLTAIFDADLTVAAVCGRVRTPAGSAGIGYAAGFDPHRREYAGRLPPAGEDWGLSANLAIRRDVLSRVGWFDEMLGAGAPLRSGAEYDLLFRIWRAGLKVINAREVEVLHLGVRPYGPKTQALFHGYGIGVGAAFIKHVRLGDREGIRLYAQWLFRCLSWVVNGFVRNRRPAGVRFTIGFLRGSLMSLRYEIDGPKRMYVPRSGRQLPSREEVL